MRLLSQPSLTHLGGCLPLVSQVALRSAVRDFDSPIPLSIRVRISCAVVRKVRVQPPYLYCFDDRDTVARGREKRSRRSSSPG